MCSEIMGKLEEISIWGGFGRYAHENDLMKKKNSGDIRESRENIWSVGFLCVFK